MDTAAKVVRTKSIKAQHPGRNLMLIAVILVLAGGAYFYFKKPSQDAPAYWTFKDDINQIQVSLPERWRPVPSEGFLRILSNPENPKELSMLISIKPISEAVEYFGLRKEDAAKIQVGEKSLSMGYFEEPILSTDGEPAGTAAFTRLYWIDADGTDYLFEIFPAQEEVLDRGIREIISSLKAI